MASGGQLRDWIADLLATFLVRPNSVSADDVIMLAAECSSSRDLAVKLLDLGFTPSPETFEFASNAYNMVSRSTMCITDDQIQDKVASDPIEEQEASKLSSDKGSNDHCSQLQGSKGLLSEVESANVDEDDYGRNVSGASEEEDENGDNFFDDMERKLYLQQWVADKLITLLDYPKSISANEIIRLAEGCTSTDALVAMLVKCGFRSSLETCNFALDIYAKVTHGPSIISELYEEDGVNKDVDEEEVTELYLNTIENKEDYKQKELYEEDGVNKDVDEEEVTELYLNTIENKEDYKQKYIMPEADHFHENAGEEKSLSAVLPPHEDHECKGSRSPKAEEQQEKPGLNHGCIDKLSSDDSLFVSEVIDFVNSPVMLETMGESKTVPVNRFRDDLLKAVQEHKVIIIVDETGSGKTTQVPQILHEAGHTAKGKIACVQPHPVAALCLAAIVSKAMGVNLGDEVGCSLRFEDLSSVGTVIKYTTAEVLMRELIVDPDLSRYSVVMITDTTERSLANNILFGMMKFISLSRPDLKLLISSTSLNVKSLHDQFCSAKVLGIHDDRFCLAPAFKIRGWQRSVEIYHTKAPVRDYVDAVANTIIQINMKETVGDILVFLPAEEHAQEVNEIIDQSLEKMPYKLIMCPLYSNLSVDLLANTLKVATPSDRKVILVNDIAEVPPALDGIKYVIDTGFCTVKSYNPSLGIEYLLICPISKASAKERAGMSGWTRPQKCYRLYTSASYHELEDSTTPETERSNLAAMVLTLKTLGINDLVHFPYLDPPQPEAGAKALTQIYALGALNNRALLTRTGRTMVEFPLDPMLSKMIVASEKYGCSVEVIKIAAMLSVGNSVFYYPKNSQHQAQLAKLNFHTGNAGDHIALLNVYNSWEKSAYSTQWCHDNYIQADSMRRAKQIHDLLEKIVKMVGIELCSNANDFVNIKKAIISGFFYHAARHHEDDTYMTIEDPQIVHIDPKSGLAEVCPQWVIFHEIVFNTGDHIGQVTEVEPEWLLEIAPHVYKNEDIADSGTKKLSEDG